MPDEERRDESAWARARHDTSRAFHTLRFWLIEAVAEAGLLALTIALLPDTATRAEQIVAVVIVGIAGIAATLGLIYVVQLFRAPYRQRYVRADPIRDPAALLHFQNALTAALIAMAAGAFPALRSAASTSHQVRSASAMPPE